MKELLETIAKYLVDSPEAIEVSASEEKGTITLELCVAQDDMGKVIGKQGKIAKAIRSVIKSAAIHKNIRVNVEITNKEEKAQA